MYPGVKSSGVNCTQVSKVRVWKVPRCQKFRCQLYPGVKCFGCQMYPGVMCSGCQICQRYRILGFFCAGVKHSLEPKVRVWNVPVYFILGVNWWVYFVSESIVRESKESDSTKLNNQNAIELQLLMKLYAFNEIRYQFWRKSKVGFLRKGKNEEEMGQNLKLCYHFYLTSNFY